MQLPLLILIDEIAVSELVALLRCLHNNGVAVPLCRFALNEIGVDFPLVYAESRGVGTALLCSVFASAGVIAPLCNVGVAEPLWPNDLGDLAQHPVLDDSGVTEPLRQPCKDGLAVPLALPNLEISFAAPLRTRGDPPAIGLDAPLRRDFGELDRDAKLSPAHGAHPTRCIVELETSISCSSLSALDASLHALIAASSISRATDWVISAAQVVAAVPVVELGARSAVVSSKCVFAV